MANELSNRRIAFLTANEGVERVELTEPWNAVEAAGGEPVLVALEAGTVQTFDHLDPSETFEATVAAQDADVDDYAALVLPGGAANPDQVRMNDAAVRFASAFFPAGKPVAVICHGPWTLVEADVLKGRSLTSWPSVRTDIENGHGSMRRSSCATKASMCSFPAASPTTSPPLRPRWWRPFRPERSFHLLGASHSVLQQVAGRHHDVGVHQETSRAEGTLLAVG